MILPACQQLFSAHRSVKSSDVAKKNCPECSLALRRTDIFLNHPLAAVLIKQFVPPSPSSSELSAEAGGVVVVLGTLVVGAVVGGVLVLGTVVVVAGTVVGVVLVLGTVVVVAGTVAGVVLVLGIVVVVTTTEVVVVVIGTVVDVVLVLGIVVVVLGTVVVVVVTIFSGFTVTIFLSTASRFWLSVTIRVISRWPSSEKV